MDGVGGIYKVHGVLLGWMDGQRGCMMLENVDDDHVQERLNSEMFISELSTYCTRRVFYRRVIWCHVI